MIIYKFHIVSRNKTEDYKFLKWAQDQEEMNKIVTNAKTSFNSPHYQVFFEQIEVEEVANISMESMKNKTFAEIVELHRILNLRGVFSKE